MEILKNKIHAIYLVTWQANRRRWAFPPLTRPFIQLLPCLVFTLFSFVTSSVTFLLAVAAAKRQAGHISDGGYYQRWSWRWATILQKSKSGLRHHSWLHYWTNLIGSLYGPGRKPYVTLLALSALCVSTVNLWAPPSPLPFYVQLKATFQMKPTSDRAKGVWHLIGRETAI